MNQTLIHLVVSHLPIFGSILGTFALAQGLWTKRNPTIVTAFTLFTISALGVGMAYITGEAAEETAENIQRVGESTIEQHEEFALLALVGVIILEAVCLFISVLEKIFIPNNCFCDTAYFVTKFWMPEQDTWAGRYATQRSILRPPPGSTCRQIKYLQNEKNNFYNRIDINLSVCLSRQCEIDKSK